MAEEKKSLKLPLFQQSVSDPPAQARYPPISSSPASAWTPTASTTTGPVGTTARYYDPEIGRFISADTIVPDPMNPQSLNRYSYCLNNPLRYIDPTGHELQSIEYAGNYYIWDDDGSYSSCSSTLSQAQQALLDYAAYKKINMASVSFGNTILTAFQGSLIFQTGAFPSDATWAAYANTANALINLWSAGLSRNPSGVTPNWSQSNSGTFSAAEVAGSGGEVSGITAFRGCILATEMPGGGTIVEAKIFSSSTAVSFDADLLWTKGGSNRSKMNDVSTLNTGCNFLTKSLPAQINNISIPINPKSPNDCQNMIISFIPRYRDLSFAMGGNRTFTRPLTVDISIK